MRSVSALLKIMEKEVYPLIKVRPDDKFPENFVKYRMIKKGDHEMAKPFLVAFFEQVYKKNLIRELINYLEGKKTTTFGEINIGNVKNKFVKRLIELSEGKIDLETIWKYIDKEKHYVVSSFNKISATLGVEEDENDFFKKMADTFEIYIKFYIDRDKSREFGSKKDSLMEIYLFGKGSSKHAYILYPIGIAEKIDSQASEIIMGIIDCKLLEANMLMNIVGSQDFNDTFNSTKIVGAIDEFIKLKGMDGMGTDNIEKRVKEWKTLPLEHFNHAKLNTKTEEFKKASETETEPELHKVYCLCCFIECSTKKKPIINLRCGHQICLDCFKNELKTRKPYIMKCLLPTCRYVLSDTELPLIDFPKDFVTQYTENCGMCGCDISEANSKCFHKKSKRDCHSLCFTCLRYYVLQISKGQVYEYQSATCKFKDYPCPFAKCNLIQNVFIGKIKKTLIVCVLLV